MKFLVMSRCRFKSKIILPKWGYLIKIKILTQVLEKIATFGYILPERSRYGYKHPGGSIHNEG